MSRSITVIFRRDAARDRRRDGLPFAGYRMLWPGGREVEVGLESFCRYGQRLLGLDRHLDGAEERLIEVLCFPISDPGAPTTRLPGRRARARRFFLERRGVRGRLHFLDGTPTEVDFVLGRDEPRVVEWIGLAGAPDGDRICVDLAARPVEPAPIAIPDPAVIAAVPSLFWSATGPLSEEGLHT